jgi:hypothetical protein
MVVEGDSGAVVIDAESGNLYGHVVMGCAGTRVAYIVAAVEVFHDIKARLGSELGLAVNPNSQSNMAMNEYGTCHVTSPTAFKGVQPNTNNDDCLLLTKRRGTGAPSNNQMPSLGGRGDVDTTQLTQKPVFDAEHGHESESVCSGDQSSSNDSDPAYGRSPDLEDETTTPYRSIRSFMGANSDNTPGSWKVDVVEDFCALGALNCLDDGG